MDKLMEMVKAIITGLRYIVFCFTITLSMFWFALYSAFKMDEGAYYEAAYLTEEQSDELKDLLDFSRFSALTINRFDCPLVSWPDDAVGYYTFRITISDEQYLDFLEFIDKEVNQSFRLDNGEKPYRIIARGEVTYAVFSKEQPCVVVHEDGMLPGSMLHGMEIEYIIDLESDGGIYGYLCSNGKERRSMKNLILIPVFLLVLFLNCLIILPYKKIGHFISTLRNEEK